MITNKIKCVFEILFKTPDFLRWLSLFIDIRSKNSKFLQNMLNTIIPIKGKRY